MSKRGVCSRCEGAGCVIADCGDMLDICPCSEGSGKVEEPRTAYAFTNGMLVVFDARGNQVPEYQGKTAEHLPRLRADWPDVIVHEDIDWGDVRRGMLKSVPS